MFAELEYGTQFRIGNTEYEVLRKRDEDLEVYNITTDCKELLSLKEILGACNAKQHDKRLFFSKRDTEEQSNSLEFTTGDYSEAERTLMEQRYKIIEPFISGKLKPAEVADYVKNYPENDKPKGALSPASFYRWVNAWYKRRNKLDLIPKRTGPKSGNRVPVDVMKEVSVIITKYDKKAEVITIRDEFNVLETTIKNINLTREDNQKLKPISESTFRRLYRQHHDSYERDKEILGTNMADLKHNGVGDATRASRPLEVMELDWTPVDCLIIDFDSDETFRPIIMYGIDQATSEPMGFNIVFKQEPDAGDWKQLILHCILPKTDIKEKYPKVQGEWSAYGVPQSILLDNAKVNDSLEVAEVCNALNIGLRYAEVKSGHHKGLVEHALGNLNHKAFQGLMGSLFSNTDEKGEYDAQAKAVVNIEGLYQIVHIAIVDLVANNFNRGINKQGVPEHLWKEGLRQLKVHPKLPYNREYLELIFSSNSVFRTVVPKGIELMGHFFYSEELNELRKRLEREGKSRVVQVRYGQDMRVIYVRDEQNRRYIEAFIKNAGLERKKLNREFPIHAELLAYLTNKDGKHYNEFDRSNLGRARLAIEEIQEDCKQEYKGVKRKRRREAAVSENIPSASKGVPSELIPGIADSITIHHVTDIVDKKGIKGVKSVKDDIVNDESLNPGELHVAEIDLDVFAADWGYSRKELG
ncbi:hypothetical protein ACFFSY_18010 [Paenibacillus aurantiacus]|uniref:Transposase n=1 Tax=Paenibacillus aurantiacus TaxID=1936118 RepID=A0ABV5KRG3_9BACL